MGTKEMSPGHIQAAAIIPSADLEKGVQGHGEVVILPLQEG